MSKRSLPKRKQSTACMANHEIDARLCRWLLRARDLSGSDQLPFTQEFLAEMLGVQRTSVTTVARTLQEAGMVKYPRGNMSAVGRFCCKSRLLAMDRPTFR